MTSKDSAPESEEQRYRLKCKELKRRIEEVNDSNELATLAINRTKTSIRRMRLEYSILLERLESNAVKFPEFGEEMSPPPSPSFDVNEKPKSANKKQKKVPVPIKSRIRDPNLPKRPTNAYLIFCEIEKERIKKETGDQTLSSVQELGKTLVEKWKALDEEAKKPYHKLYDEDKERYKKEMAVYSGGGLEKNATEEQSQTDVSGTSKGIPELSNKAQTGLSGANEVDEDNDNEANDTHINDNDEEEVGVDDEEEDGINENDDDDDDSKMDVDKEDYANELPSEIQSELPSELPSEPPSEPASEPGSDGPEVKEESV